jgi:hypothetical protein
MDPSNNKAGWQMVDFYFSATQYLFIYGFFLFHSSLAQAGVMLPLSRPGRPTCRAGDGRSGSASEGGRRRRVSSLLCGGAGHLCALQLEWLQRRGLGG